MPVVLTIAGSDSGGGAGIQADIKTFEALGVFGTSALTCVTAQNPERVFSVQPLPPDIVRDQIVAVFSAFPVAAVKTGMLYSAEIIKAVAESLSEYPKVSLVVDPVMIATSGARLLQENAIAALRDFLFPLAKVITPNLHEAEALAGTKISNLAGLRDSASALASSLGTAVVVKGGHLDLGAEVSDVLAEPSGKIYEFRAVRLKTAQTHGTGCSFSAALASYLAMNVQLPLSVEKAQKFVAKALEFSARYGNHQPLGWKQAGMH